MPNKLRTYTKHSLPHTFTGILIIITTIILVIFTETLLLLRIDRPFGCDVALCDLVAIQPIIFLLLGFLVSLSWVLFIYFKTRSKLLPEDESQTAHDNFKTIAWRHQQLSQLWFSIAITILLGAIIFAIFQLSPMTCEDICNINGTSNIEDTVNNIKTTSSNFESTAIDVNGSENELKGAISNLHNIDDSKGSKIDWREFLVNLLSGIFIYFLFFACWLWAIKNYKVHLHAYLSNEYRFTALDQLEKMPGKSDGWVDRELQERILLKKIELVGSIPLSMHLDKEQGETAAQKIIKIEEMLQELLTKSHK